MSRPAYYLGCPIWGNKAWVGGFFAPKTRAGDFLRQYASVFSSVEGNTTFYGIPKAETVSRWLDATPDGFRFAFKFPKTISHEKRLIGVEPELDHFFSAMAPLGERLGPFFLQLPPGFDDIDALARFLFQLPGDFRYAVEVRHPRFYGEDAFERELHDLLRQASADLVIFDSRRLQQLQTEDAELLDAQRRKPSSPIRFIATGSHPFLRYVGDPAIENDRDILEEWAGRVASWIGEGKVPYVFMHQAPDDVRAPELAGMFHQMVRARLPVIPRLPPWPAAASGGAEQLSLF